MDSFTMSELAYKNGYERGRAEALTSLAKEIHQIAIDKGWWETPPKFGETVALCHAELSEALEEYRAERPALWYEGAKPEGVAVEMADCLIRILDWFGHTGLDVDGIVRTKTEYNKTRPYRHGGKRL